VYIGSNEYGEQSKREKNSAVQVQVQKEMPSPDALTTKYATLLCILLSTKTMSIKLTAYAYVYRLCHIIYSSTNAYTNTHTNVN